MVKGKGLAGEVVCFRQVSAASACLSNVVLIDAILIADTFGLSATENSSKLGSCFSNATHHRDIALLLFIVELHRSSEYQYLRLPVISAFGTPDTRECSIISAFCTPGTHEYSVISAFGAPGTR